MEVYLIRHTSVAIDKHVCYGQHDVALSSTFEEEAFKIKEHISTIFDKLYSSPSTRCRLLAEKLDANSIAYDDRLLELNFGDWENKKWNEIDAQELHHWMNDFVHVKPSNGENLNELFGRTKVFMDELRSQPFTKVALVTHAGFLRCAMAYLLEIPLTNIFKLSIDYGQVLVIELGKEKQYDLIKM